MNDKPETKIGYISPLKRICMTIGELPTSYLETMSYYEMLIWFTKFLQEKVIPTIDNNAQAVEELQHLFIELQSYVNNYFDNLDVQDEINNKLDDMIEAGTLQEIIADYLNSKAVFGFDNVESMKNATNLIDGSYARTLGYYSKNDGGDALYKVRTITNDDVVDEMFIIELNDNTLIAELIVENDSVNTNQVGLKANDENFDNTTLLTSLITKCNTKGYNIDFNNGAYYFTNSIIINDILSSIQIRGKGNGYYDNLNSKKGTLLIYKGTDYLFTFTNTLWSCILKDFSILCNNTSGGSGIHTSGNFYKSHIENVWIINSYNGIEVEKFAYGYFDNITITCSNNDYTPNIGIQLGSNSGTTEYAYINNLILQFRNQLGTGIKIKKGIHFEIRDCDIVFCETGLLIEPTVQCNWFDVQDIDFARCKIAIHFNLTYFVVGGTFSNIVINYTETADNTHYGILATPHSNYRLNNIDFKNINLRTLGNQNQVNGFDFTNVIYSGGIIDINSMANSDLIINKIKTDNYQQNPIVKYNRPMNWVINKSNTDTSVTYTLLNNSPFITTPQVMVVDTRNKISSYSISNTNGSTLSITINLTEGVNDKFFISIPDSSYSQNPS